MTKTQLAEIESALAMRLPADYRRVALQFPFETIGNDWVYWFYDEPSRVIEATQAPLVDGGYDGAGWQKGYLAIGSSAAGDIYLMDTEAAELPIHCLSHENHAIELEWPTFAAFVAEWQRLPEETRRREAEELAALALENRQRRRLGLRVLAAAIGLPLVAGLLILILGALLGKS